MEQAKTPSYNHYDPLYCTSQPTSLRTKKINGAPINAHTTSIATRTTRIPNTQNGSININYWTQITSGLIITYHWSQNSHNTLNNKPYYINYAIASKSYNHVKKNMSIHTSISHIIHSKSGNVTHMKNILSIIFIIQIHPSPFLPKKTTKMRTTKPPSR